MKEQNLDTIRNLIYKLVRIANQETDEKLSPAEAKLTVRVIDLVENSIAFIPDDYFKGYIEKVQKEHKQAGFQGVVRFIKERICQSKN